MSGSSLNGSTTEASKPSEPEPEDAESLKEKGNAAFKAGKYGSAVDLYTKAIDMSPSEPTYHSNRAAAYMSLKQFRKALADCQQALALQPSPTPSSPSPSSPKATTPPPALKVLFRLARCQLALGQPTPALSTLSTLLSQDPGNAPAKQTKFQAEQLQSHLDNVEKAKKGRDWGMARLALDKCFGAVEGQGSEVPIEWRVWRIELEVARGSWDAAGIAANDALRLEPNSPEVLYQRGLVLFLTGKLTQALNHAASALRLDPANVPAQSLRKRTKDVERLKEEGNNAFKSSKWQEALEKYEEALERVGEKEEEGKGGQIRATLLSNKATTLLKMDDYTAALSTISASLLLSPNSFKALRTRARIQLSLESYEDAVRDFKAAQDHAESDADRKAAQIELKKAEAALKRSKTKDYYKILGVARDCGDAEIKKAYRRESLKHHPDKGGDEEKFKLVVEAHAVLSDADRRHRYDMGEDEDGLNDGSAGGSPFGAGGVDLSELFAQFHGAGGGSPFGGGGGFGGGFGGSPFGGGGGFRSSRPPGF
jgi:DnaJ family protein C protein 7